MCISYELRAVSDIYRNNVIYISDDTVQKCVCWDPESSCASTRK